MKHNYEQRRQNRIRYAKEMAAKKKQESERLYSQAKNMASVIPLGQPILVGHHSEFRDRNYREKIHNTFGKAFKSSDTAMYYEDKAETIESNRAISSDDPQAITKLQQKLERVKASHAFMKAANAFIRKNDKAGFLALQGATEALWNELHEPRHGGIGYPHYKLPYALAEIGRLEARIATLKKYDGQDNEEIEAGGVRIMKNVLANRLQIFFPSIPDEETRKRLKGAGFHWCRSEGAWQRQLSSMAEYLAKQFLRLE